MKFLPICLSMVLPCLAAVEPPTLPLEVGMLKLRDGTVYEGTKVTGHDAVGVKLMHSGGTARVPYAKLPKDLADKFPRDVAGAKEQLEKEAKAEAAHGRTVDKALAKEAQEEKVDIGTEESPLEKMPDSKGDVSAKIFALESYVRRLESGISQAQTAAADARSRASSYRSQANASVTRRDASGNLYTVDSYNTSKYRKAEFHERRAIKQEAKIKEAEDLIQIANSKISVLKKEHGGS